MALENYPPNLIPHHGEAFLFNHFFDGEDSAGFFNDLYQQTPWRHEAIVIFGKQVMQPRLTAWYGDPGKAYAYSGITMQPEPWTAALLEIKQKIEAVAGVVFNSALLNLYRDGNDSMGWHRDNEKELGPNPVIASVSFGAPRSFCFRAYHDKSDTITIELKPGSLLLMQGETQHYWQHGLPKTVKNPGPRINVTFRVVL